MKRFTSFQAFQLYVALKNYFFGEYDIFKYGYKVNVKFETFQKRSDVWIFERLVKTYKRAELVDVFVSNYVQTFTPIWIGDILHEDCETIYKDWQRKMQSLTYTFKQDLGYLNDYLLEKSLIFQDLFMEDKVMGFPLVYRFILSKKITLETVTILDKFYSFAERDKTVYQDNPSISALASKIRKYQPFVKVSREKYTQILGINSSVGVAQPTPV